MPKEQNDAHEFLMFLVNYLNECLKPEQGVNFIDEFFRGEIKNTITCNVCKTKVSYEEICYDLSLPVNYSEKSLSYETYIRNRELLNGFIKKIKALFTHSFVINIKDCLRTYFEDSEVNDLRDLRQCNHCGEKTPFVRSSKIKKPPKNLLLVLKRYGSVGGKLKVTFPLELNLSEIASEKCGAVRYELYSLITHVGLNNLGHYKCYCRNHLDSKWYLFNDNKILEIPSTKLKNVSAYIAFYSLVSNN
jgi:ubiquitin C-terminal hydrolase